MNDLREIFTTTGLLLDQNQDGIPDGIDASFIITKDAPVLGMIDFMARLGLETSELNLPEINPVDTSYKWTVAVDLGLQTGESDAVCELIGSENKIKIAGRDEKLVSMLLRWFAAEWPHVLNGLHIEKKIKRIHLVHNKILLLDSDATLGSLEIRQKESVVGQKAQPNPLSSLSDLWTFSGFYQAGRVDITSKTDVGFTGIHDSETMFSCARLSARIGLASTGIRFPLTDISDRIPELTFSIQKANNETNQAKVLWDEIPEKGASRRILFQGSEMSINQAIEYFASAVPIEDGGEFAVWESQLKSRLETENAVRQFPIVFEKAWSDDGERHELENSFSELIDQLDQNIVTSLDKTPITITAFISEPFEIRTAIRDRWNQIVSNRFPTMEFNVDIHSSFKPGFHWVKEVIIPFLKIHEKKYSKIRILFSPENREGGMELQHRWLQELYPADQLLEKELGISIENIELTMEPGLKSTYSIYCLDENHDAVYQWDLLVPVTSIPYLEGGKSSYPTTSQLACSISGREMYRHTFDSDRIRFWKFFQKEILPSIGEFSLKQAEGTEDGFGTLLPLFHSLEVHVEMSEPEERLDLDEEAISSLEALHEDIYFYTLDYFSHLGEKVSGTKWDTPGAVKPFLKRVKGSRPHAKIILKKYTRPNTVEVTTTSLLFSSESHTPVEAEVEYKVDGKPFRENIDLLSKEWMPKKEEEFPNEFERLSHDPAVHIWTVAKSFEERPVYAIEATSPKVSSYRFTHKLALFKPTILIETGHHSNEVSSMPAAIELIEDIIQSEPNLLDKINLVVIPCANPDSQALHRQLVQDNPYWKHHAARYNAVGLEYSKHRFKETIFGEATVVPKLFSRWLPDCAIDDHGIPSHEWTQPFAGYNSPPSFPVSYWVPVALIYGIARELNREDFPRHAEVLDHVIKTVKSGIQKDEKIWEKNSHYRDRYIRYGHNWDSQVFPLEEEGEMIFYRWPTTPSRNDYSLLARYPEWVTLDIISEAADETVLGDALNDCILSHKLFDRSIVDWIASRSHVQSIRRKIQQGFVQLIRNRPL